MRLSGPFGILFSFWLDGGFELSKPQDGESRMRIRMALGNARDRTGIDDCRFHGSRHVFASSLAMAGVVLNTIRELLCHKTVMMVMRYSHLTDCHKADVVAPLYRSEDSKARVEMLGGASR